MTLAVDVPHAPTRYVAANAFVLRPPGLYLISIQVLVGGESSPSHLTFVERLPVEPIRRRR